MDIALFNKTDYLILEKLISYGCVSPMASLTFGQLEKETLLSKNKVRTAIKGFSLTGIVSEGNKDGNKKTFYITENGIDHCMKVFKLSREEILDNQYED